MDAETLAYRHWRRGQAVPGRVTLARAYLNLGPQNVANVCGTDAEAVDLWELGIEYPTWDELGDLALLSSLPIGFFMRPVEGPGALFAVPDSWEGDGHERDGLVSTCCQEGVRDSVRGWPRTLDRLHDTRFA